MTSEEIHAGLLRVYRGYIERNDSFGDFASDVNTLGGTFLDGYFQTTGTHAVVEDRDSGEIWRYLLKDIYEAVRGDQMTLDL